MSRRKFDGRFLRGHPLKSQAKSDYARKSDVSSIPHVPSTLKLFSALCLPKLMRHQIITFRGWQIFSFSFFFETTKRNLRENKKIYKLGQNEVLGLDLLRVHQRIDSLWHIAKAYKALAGLSGGRRPFNVFTLELSDEMVKHSPELKSICRASSVDCLGVSLVFNFPPCVALWFVRQRREKYSV